MDPMGMMDQVEMEELHQQVPMLEELVEEVEAEVYSQEIVGIMVQLEMDLIQEQEEVEEEVLQVAQLLLEITVIMGPLVQMEGMEQTERQGHLELLVLF
jgi:hypothetical protein